METNQIIIITCIVAITTAILLGFFNKDIRVTIKMEDEGYPVKDDDVEVKKAFIYELANHEYCITYNVDDTLDALNITLEELKNDERLKKILKEATNEYLENSENL